MSEKPFLVALNLTKRCNLACAHCYLDAGTRECGDVNELDGGSVKRILTEISEVNPACMVVLTGGEPLLRPDIFELCEHAAALGLMVVVGTNGTLLTEKNIRRLLDAGVCGAGISVDGLSPAFHDVFRGLSGAWLHTMQGIDHCRRLGLAFQIHTSVHQANVAQVDEIMSWAHETGALVINFFFLVCTGRGERMTDITPEQYEQVLGQLVAAQNRFPGMLVRARCAPHFKRLAYQQDADSPITKAQGYEGGGCMAGTRYCRVTPDGQVTACPYIDESAGSLHTQSFGDLWQAEDSFRQLRAPKLSGKCGECEFQILCGGCRARPFAANGDLMGEDTLCSYMPHGGEVIQPLIFEEQAVRWEPAASERLEKLPYFLRSMIRGKVEQAARERNDGIVTLALMDELRRARFGDGAPTFSFKGKSDVQPWPKKRP